MARKAPKRRLVPNAPLRKAYLASGQTACAVCRGIGWTHRDTSRLHRQLGIMPYQASMQNGGYKAVQTEMSRHAAELICQFLDIEFDDLYEGIVKPRRPAAHCRTCGNPMMRRTPEGQCGLCHEEVELFGQIAVAA